MISVGTLSITADNSVSSIFNFHPIDRLLRDVGIVGLVLAVLGLVANTVLSNYLARDLRRALRLPAALLWLYVSISLARCFVRSETEIDQMFRVTSAVCFSLSVAQFGFVFVVDFIVGRNGKHPVRPLIRYGLMILTYLVAALAGLRAGGITTVGVLASGAVVIGGFGAAVAEILRQVGAGVLVQYARPFELGDVIVVAPFEKRGKVISMDWRATLLRGPDGLEFQVPNSDLITKTVINFGRGDRTFRREVAFSASYDAAPEVVSDAVLQAIRTIERIEREPKPKVVLVSFADSSINYQLWYWTKDAENYDELDAEVRMRIWYAFARHGLEFPFPVRHIMTLQPREQKVNELELAETLRKTGIFGDLTNEHLLHIVATARMEPYHSGETIVIAGERTRSMFIILDGEVAVFPPRSDVEIRRLSAGEFFGEIALVTGSPRTATIRATKPTRTLMMDEASFKQIVSEYPGVMETLSDILTSRKEDLALNVTMMRDKQPTQAETRGAILDKIRSLFGPRNSQF